MGFEVFENYKCDGQMEMNDYTGNRQLTHLSLFSGIGGLDLAAEWAGFKSVGQCEWADYPTEVLEKHWPDVSRWRDIRTLTGESFYERTNRRTVDVISGGFPCQPFSVAGKQRGEDDDRYLWLEMVRVIKELRPTWVVGENVAGIINMALDTVLSDLEAAGYTVRTFVIPACGVNAPHQRYRTAIVAHTQGNNTGRLSIRERARRSPDLASAVKMWPTPMATDARGYIKPGNPVIRKNGTIRHKNKSGGQSMMRLSQVVRLFPTPTAQDAKNSTFPQSQINRDSVVGKVMRDMYPTPTASDYRRRGPNSKQQGLPEKVRQMDQESISQGNQVGGQLNPVWVEWLMGFPIGWTELNASETQ